MTLQIIGQIKERARNNIKTIVLPEGEEERVLLATRKIQEEKLAEIILLSKSENIYKRAREVNVSLEGITVIIPDNHPDKQEYAHQYLALRKHKGITMEEASLTLSNPLYFGCMLVRNGKAHGLVGGSVNTTAETVRAAFQVIGAREGVSTVSSFLLMIVPDCSYGNNGNFLFADCAVIPNPSPEQLADIAISTAKNASLFLDVEPCVAMLSFSTKGSAKHKMVEKIRRATEIVREKNKEIIIDGELQVDAALIPEVAKIKVSDSNVAGKANVLIFPDLNSGNIAYKLVQRLAHAKAYGPILQGLKRPINDLSRGCSVDDIINVVCITSVQ